MSSSSPFRTEENKTYRWPPEPAPMEREYVRVTKLIGDGEPKPWMKNHVAGRIVGWLSENYGTVIDYLVNSHNETPEQFSIDQEWWSGELDKAEKADVKAEQKLEAWKNGELPHLKSRPPKPYKVNSLLRLTPPRKLQKFLKAIPDIYRDKAAWRGTSVHKYAELVSLNNDVVIDDPVEEAHVRNTVRFFDQFQPDFFEVESVVYSDRYGFAGQFDWLARFEVARLRQLVDAGVFECPDLELWEAAGLKTVTIMGDYKTSVKGIKESVGLQFAAYSTEGNYIGRVDGTKDPLPHIDSYWAINVREDDCEVVPVAISEEVREDFVSVMGTRRWIKETSKTVLPSKARKAA